MLQAAWLIVEFRSVDQAHLGTPGTRLTLWYVVPAASSTIIVVLYARSSFRFKSGALQNSSLPRCGFRACELSAWKLSQMPPTDEAVHFQMQSCSGPQLRCVDAALTITHAKSQHSPALPGWKAVIRVSNPRKSERLFGNWRSTIVAAVDVLMQQHARRISQEEMDRVLHVVSSMQARRSSNLSTSALGSLLSRAPNTQVGHASPSTAQCTRKAPTREPPVQYIHQIYGLFADGKPLSPLFETSQRTWQSVAEDMGAQYVLWDADALESLMKQRYPTYWDMYCNVRYPIMRCDIGRLAIVHTYGGLYSDLDIVPNRNWYAQVDLALPRVRAQRETPGKAPSARTRTNSCDWEEYPGAMQVPSTLWLAAQCLRG